MSEKILITIDQYEIVPYGSTVLIRGINYDTGLEFQSEELIDPDLSHEPESKNHIYKLLHAKGEQDEQPDSEKAPQVPDSSADPEPQNAPVVQTDQTGKE